MTLKINHLYHEGWDCVCAARQTSSIFFRATVHCRSLINGNIFALPAGLVDFANEAQAIDMAMQAAFVWTRENKHPIKADSM